MHEKLMFSYANSSDEEEDETDAEENGHEDDQSTEAGEDDEESSELEESVANGAVKEDIEGKQSDHLVPSMGTLSIENLKDIGTMPTKESQNKKKYVPPTSTLVNVAIKNLCERKGSSVQAIKKYIINNYPEIDEGRLRVSMNKYLRKAVADGTLEQTKGVGATGSFKISAKSAKEEILAEKIKAKKEKVKLLQKEKQKKLQEKKKLAEEKKKIQKEKEKTKENLKVPTATKTTTTSKTSKSPNAKNKKKTEIEKAAILIVENSVKSKSQSIKKKNPEVVEVAEVTGADVGVEVEVKQSSRQVEIEKAKTRVNTGAIPKATKKTTKKTAKPLTEKQNSKKPTAAKKLKGDKALDAILANK